MDEASSSCPSDEDEDDEDDEQDDEEEEDEDTTPDCSGLIKSSSSVRCFLGWVVCASLPAEESFLFKSDPSARRKMEQILKRCCLHKYYIQNFMNKHEINK